MEKDTIIYENLCREYNKIKVQEEVNITSNNDKLTKEFLMVLVKLDKIKELRNGNLIKVSPSQFYLGRLIKKTNFGFVEVSESTEDFFIKNVEKYMDKDYVILEEIPDKGKSRAGIIRKLVKRSNELLIVRITAKGRPVLMDDDNDTRKIEIVDVDDKSLQPRSVLAIKVITMTKNIIRAKLHNVISDQNDPDLKMKVLLTKYSIDVDFPKSIDKELENIEEEIPNSVLEQREDLRDKYFFTIDGADSKDLDDAITLETKGEDLHLYVSIADVSHYVEENTKLDKVARDRATSVYFIDRVVPMLPKKISNGICSLHPNVDRLTMTCEIVMNNDGKILDTKIYPSVINSHRRFTYTEVNDILQDKQEDKDREVLRKMDQFAKKLRQKRETAGSFNLEDTDAKFELDEKGEIVNIVPINRGDGEKLIEEFMILANEQVTEYASKKNLPFIYRVHGTPTPKKMDDLRTNLHYLQIDSNFDEENLHPQDFKEILDEVEDANLKRILTTSIVRSMQKAIYTTDNIGHFGLALDNYTHFTSPIRRYPDLEVHRLLKQYINEDYKVDMGVLNSIAEHSSEKEVNAIKAEQEIEDYKKAEYMKQFIGKVFTGTVGDIEDYGVFVELENTVRGLIRYSDLKDFKNMTKFNVNFFDGRKLEYGEKIDVRISGVNLSRGLVDFEPVGFDVYSREEKKKRKDKARREKNKSRGKMGTNKKPRSNNSKNSKDGKNSKSSNRNGKGKNRNNRNKKNNNRSGTKNHARNSEAN